MGLNILAVSTFRKRLSTAFLTNLKNNPLTLLSHSRPIAVVMDYEDYETMQTELARLKEEQFQEVESTLQDRLKTHKRGDTSALKRLSEVTAAFDLGRSEEAHKTQ